jgi:hypothetical protein
MRFEEDFEIDGENYKVKHFSATRGTRIFARLVKFAGEPVAKFLSAGKAIKENDEVAANAVLGQAITALSSRIDENEVEGLIKDILDSVQVIDAKSGKLRAVGAEYFDVHFQGRIGHLFKVLGKTVAFQYSDFLGDLAGLQGLQNLASKPEPKSRTT